MVLVRFINEVNYLIFMSWLLLFLLILGCIGSIYWVLKGEKFNRDILK